VREDQSVASKMTGDNLFRVPCGPQRSNRRGGLAAYSAILDRQIVNEGGSANWPNSTTFCSKTSAFHRTRRCEAAKPFWC
jgi:hypothetical protein